MLSLCHCSPECPIPAGTCHCGCGQTTKIALRDSPERGHLAGKPLLWALHHSASRRYHGLREIDERARTAYCAVCERKVTIKHNSGSHVLNEWRCTGRLITNQHLVRDINVAERTGYCRGCEAVVPIIKRADTNRGWVCANKQRALKDAAPGRFKIIEETPQRKEKRRIGKLRRKYGLTAEQYAALVEKQGGRCAICKCTPAEESPPMNNLGVSYDEANDRVRGLICRRCILGVGSFRDDPRFLFQAALFLHNLL